MNTCAQCGKPARNLISVYVRQPTIAEAFATTQPLPRTALTDEQNAAIPYGQHPRDHDLAMRCENCTQA